MDWRKSTRSSGSYACVEVAEATTTRSKTVSSASNAFEHLEHLEHLENRPPDRRGQRPG